MHTRRKLLIGAVATGAIAFASTGSALQRAGKILARHRVEVELAKDLAMVDVDPVLFEQVLFNLLDNAAKYAPASTTVRIQSWRERDAVGLQVLDEGGGIPAGDLEHIFDKFYRAQKGDHVRAGTGLGLAISRGFVEAMNGTIIASNRTDRPGPVLTVQPPVRQSLVHQGDRDCGVPAGAPGHPRAGTRVRARAASGLHRLGVLATTSHDYEKAEHLLKEAVDIKRRTMGVLHPSVGDSLTVLANILVLLGRDEEAKSVKAEAQAVKSFMPGLNKDSILLFAPDIDYVNRLRTIAAMLSDQDPEVQARGALGLSRAGPEARAAVSELIPLLKSRSALARQNAALALAAVGPEAASAVPALTEALKDPEWAVRRQAAMALGAIGPAAKPAAPALQRLESDPQKPVRDAAKQARGKIGG